MKKIIFTLSMLLFMLSVINADAQWVWQNPLPHGNTVSVVKFIDKNTGWYFSGLSSNYKTTNGGLNWIKENLPTSQTIVKADYYNFDSLNSLLVLGGATGAIVKSTNKGNNWILVTSPSGNIVSDFHFFNANTGFVHIAKLYKTTDGGMSWGPGIFIDNANRSLYFLNDSLGWLCDYTVFYNHYMYTTNFSISRTTDSGNTWVRIFYNESGGNCTGVPELIFKDSAVGLVNKMGAIHKTTNTGINWYNTNFGARFDFVNNNTGFNAPGNNFAKSTDFGSTWNVIDTVFIRKINETCMEAVDSSDIYLGGTFGDITKTDNGGVNWSYLNKSFTSSNIKTIKSFDSLNLCAFAPYKFIFKSTNSGKNWSCLDTSLFGNDSLSIIFFLSKDTLWAGCVNGKIYRTYNGGNNWAVSNSPSTKTITRMKMFSSGTGFIANNLGYVYKTLDFGNNWIYINYVSQGIFTASFPDEQTIYLSDMHTMRKSSDGGLSWLNIQTIPVSDFYESINFYDTDTGYCCRRFSFAPPPPTPSLQRYNMYKTTDGGSNWIFQNQILAGSSLFFDSEIFFAGNIIYWLANDRGSVYKSENGGVNWDSEVLCQPALNTLTTFKKDIWVAGNGGTILKGNQMVPVSANNINYIIPSEYSLYQNYPNPFNPSTKIKYDLPKSGVVRLAVYDITGREVETLVNERLAAGSYEAVFDGSSFASGVYFYRLTADDHETSSGQVYTETKRMIFIK